MSVFIEYLSIGLIPHVVSYFFILNEMEFDEDMFCVDVDVKRLILFLIGWCIWPIVLIIALIFMICWLILEFDPMRIKLFNTCDLFNRLRGKSDED